MPKKTGDQPHAQVAMGCPKCRSNRMIVETYPSYPDQFRCPRCGATISDLDVAKSIIKLRPVIGRKKVGEILNSRYGGEAAPGEVLPDESTHLDK